MKRQWHRSTFACSSYVNNYDAREMAITLNESVSREAEEARQKEMCKKTEKEGTTRLTAQFTSH